MLFVHHQLAGINNTTVSTHVLRYTRILTFLSFYLEVEGLGQMGTLFDYLKTGRAHFQCGRIISQSSSE